MGKIFTKLWRAKEVRILIHGLDAAGKTTILYRLKLGEVVTTIPTIGFNVETINYKQVQITAWDLGGRDKMRALYRHYYANTDAMMFVIDSNDQERFEQITDELHKAAEEYELRDAIFCILANKQDLEGAVSPEKVYEQLNLRKLRQKHQIFATSATRGEGLYEALDWLTEELAKRQTKKPPTDSPTDKTVHKKAGLSYLTETLFSWKKAVLG